MIELVTGKDLQDIWTKLQEVIDRTKKHTIQIKELQKKSKKRGEIEYVNFIKSKGGITQMAEEENKPEEATEDKKEEETSESSDDSTEE